MSYNGSGTFNINTAGQPVVTGTVISSTAFNALTADLGTGLSTAITKDGQTVATALIPFAAGMSSTTGAFSSTLSAGNTTVTGTLSTTGKITATAGVNTASGVTASTATNTGVGIINCATYGIGAYYITAYISAAGSVYIKTARAVNDGSATVVVTAQEGGANMFIEAAGGNQVVNARQTSGNPQVINYNFLFVPG